MIVQNAKFGAETTILRKFGDKIGSLSIHNLLGWKLATFCPNSIGYLQRLTENFNFLPA